MLRCLNRSVSLFAVSAVFTLAVGCDAPGFTHKPNAPVAAPLPVGSAQTTSAPLPNKEPAPLVETAGLSVSSEIARACGLSARPDRQASVPNFEFDSAALVPEDRTLLAEVAKCLTEGALRGRNVSLVGRTDARGEPEYNMTLGGSRADAVHRYFVDLGVARDRLSTTSRGEMDATGTDEKGWSLDRRVDIELVK